MKNGLKTTEFWLTLAVAVAKVVMPDLPDEAVGAVAAYVLSRGVSKHGKKGE